MIENNIISDIPKLIRYVHLFAVYVRQQDAEKRPDELISFTDKDAYLFAEEGYKADDIDKARKELKAESWKNEWIGTEKISECVRSTIRHAGNLINNHQQVNFLNRMGCDAENNLAEL